MASTSEVQVRVSWIDDLMPKMAAVIKPGDTLVVTFNRRISVQEGDEAMRRWREIARGSSLVMLDDVAEITVLRPDDNTEAKPCPDPSQHRDVYGDPLPEVQT